MMLFVPPTHRSTTLDRLAVLFLGQPALDGPLRCSGWHARALHPVQQTESRDQAPKGRVAVPMLRSRICRHDPYTGGQMYQANRRVRHVAMLPARSTGPEGLDHHLTFQDRAV